MKLPLSFSKLPLLGQNCHLKTSKVPLFVFYFRFKSGKSGTFNTYYSFLNLEKKFENRGKNGISARIGNKTATFATFEPSDFSRGFAKWQFCISQVAVLRGQA